MSTYTAYIDPEVHEEMLRDYSQGSPVAAETAYNLVSALTREWGEDGYTMRLRGVGRVAYAICGHSDGSRFVLRCDRDGNVGLLEPWTPALAAAKPGLPKIEYVGRNKYLATIPTATGSFDAFAGTASLAVLRAYARMSGAAAVPQA